MDYRESIAALEGVLRFGVHPSLDGIRALTDAMGRPQDSFASVQVTGTNGKSSTTRVLAALVAAEGLTTAVYTSPHLESYTERVELAGALVSETDFARGITAAFDAAARAGAPADRFTEFELLTAAALWLMRDRGVDVACLEVGMGGRWDATSVVDPAVAVVTGVGLDHTERLGGTVEEIAADKARIIKPGASVVLGPGTAHVAGVFLQRSATLGLHPRFVAGAGVASPVAEELTVRFEVVAHPDRPGGTLAIDVHGVHADYTGLACVAPSYQAPNIATALAAAECVLGRALEPLSVRTALAGMTFPGRFELIADTPPVVIDGAHNPQAAEVLATAVAEAWPDLDARPWCVLGVLADKDAEGIVRALQPVVERFVVTQPCVARAREAEDLAELVRTVTATRPEIRADVATAIARAREGAGSAGVLVTGSLYTAGEARSVLHRAQPRRPFADPCG